MTKQRSKKRKKSKSRDGKRYIIAQPANNSLQIRTQSGSISLAQTIGVRREPTKQQQQKEDEAEEEDDSEKCISCTSRPREKRNWLNESWRTDDDDDDDVMHVCAITKTSKTKINFVYSLCDGTHLAVHSIDCSSKWSPGNIKSIARWIGKMKGKWGRKPKCECNAHSTFNI